jgi:hypothetical protein
VTVADRIPNEAEVWRAMEPDQPVTGIPVCDRLIEAYLFLEVVGR